MAATDHRWLERALQLQALFAGLTVAAFTVLAVAGLRFGLELQAAVLLVGIVLVGFPHGAFDHLVARPVLLPRFGRFWWAPFGLAYLGLAGVVCLAWAAAPLATMMAFLAGSVLHFGLGDTEDDRFPRTVPRWAAVLVYGTLPVLLPVAFHPVDSAPVLAALGGVDEPPMALALSNMIWLVPVWLAAFLWIARAAWREAAISAVTALGFALLPPLLAFGLYFGLVHSPRHLLRLGAWHDPVDPLRAVRWAACTVVPASVFCAVGLAALALDQQDLSRDLLAPAFRLIAALTLPHMIVTAWLKQSE